MRKLVVGMVMVAGGMSLSCSEAVPPAAEGAAFVLFATSGMCNVGAPHNGSIGFVNTQEVRDFATDTLGGASVFCLMKSSGGGFSVQGNMDINTSTDRTHLDFNIPEISNANDVGNPATGSLTYSHVETVAQYTSPLETPCEFWVGDNGQGVIEGEMWVEFRCAQINNASQGSQCGISTGSALAMRNCEFGD